jgi:hypothetical protein
MRHSNFVIAAGVAAWVGLASLAGCEGDAESESGVQTGDLRPRRDAGSPSDPVPDGDAAACTNPDPGAQCRSDGDCPVLAICRLCPDGSCANPNVRCVDGACTAPDYTCPPAPGGTACRSSQECAGGQYCTVEDGVCNPAPGCRPGGGCIAVCYGTCATRIACDAVEQRLEDFVNANKACETTDDCQVLSAGCGLSFEDGCTGGVYVNQSIDTATFSALSGALTECKGRDCAVCERLTLPPECVGGTCQRQRL